MFYVEDKRHKGWFFVKTKANDVFDVGIGPQYDDDDTNTFCENILYNLTTNDAHDGVNDKLGLA